MDKNPIAKGWWQTLPGVLTAVAAVITAIAGLVAALHQTGLFDSSQAKPVIARSDPKPPETSKQPPVAAGAPGAAASQEAAPHNAALPSGQQVRIGQVVYNIRSIGVDRYAPGKRLLVFQVQMTNNDRYDANFWDRSFRLLVGNQPQAPTNELNQLVASHAAMDGTVEFVVADDVSEVVLQIGDPDNDAATIPIRLK